MYIIIRFRFNRNCIKVRFSLSLAHQNKQDTVWCPVCFVPRTQSNTLKTLVFWIWVRIPTKKQPKSFFSVYVVFIQDRRAWYGINSHSELYGIAARPRMASVKAFASPPKLKIPVNTNTKVKYCNQKFLTFHNHKY